MVTPAPQSDVRRSTAPDTQFKMAAAGRAQRRCSRHCDLQREQRSCIRPARTPPLPPADEIPIKQPRPQPVRRGLSSRAGAYKSPFSDQRIQLSLASELNSVSCWLQGHQVGGALLGPTWKGQYQTYAKFLFYSVDFTLSSGKRSFRFYPLSLPQPPRGLWVCLGRESVFSNRAAGILQCRIFWIFLVPLEWLEKSSQPDWVAIFLHIIFNY